MVHAEMLRGKIRHHRKPRLLPAQLVLKVCICGFGSNKRLKSPDLAGLQKIVVHMKVLVHQDQLFTTDHINGDLFQIIEGVAFVNQKTDSASGQTPVFYAVFLPRSNDETVFDGGILQPLLHLLIRVLTPFHGNLRILIDKFLNYRERKYVKYSAGTANAEQSFFIFQLLDTVADFLELPNQDTRPLMEQFCALRRPHTLFRPFEEHRIQLALQHLNIAAQALRRDKQLLCRLVDAAFLIDRLKAF